MRNVVVEVRGKYAVILNNTGDFIKIKNKDYKVGQRIETYSKKQGSVFTKFITVAAAFVVILFGGGAYACYTPYSYVTVDVNPSIELEMNIFNRVIDAKALNEEAESILADVRLSGCDIDIAVNKLVGELISEGYLNSSSIAEFMVTTSCNNKNCAEDLLNKTMSALNEEIEQNDIQANIQGEVTDKGLKKVADKFSVTPGELVLTKFNAQSVGNGFNKEEDLTGKPVKEIKNNKGNDKNAELVSDSGDSSDNSKKNSNSNNGNNNGNNSNKDEDKNNSGNNGNSNKSSSGSSDTSVEDDNNDNKGNSSNSNNSDKEKNNGNSNDNSNGNSSGNNSSSNNGNSSSNSNGNSGEKGNNKDKV